MLKTLRRKFVLVSMALVALILTVVLLAGIFFTQMQFVQDYQAAIGLELSWDMRRQRRESFWTNLPPPGQRPQPAKITFTALQDGNGDWKLVTPWMQMEQDTFLSLCERAQAADSPDGFWPDLGIAYARREGRIAFANLQNEYAQLKNSRWAWILVYVGALGLFFLLALLLTNRALRPAQAAWIQQQRFISDASHELKTPLTVILANLDILENEQGGNQWLSAAKMEGLVMKKLIENLLFLARTDEMREPAEYELVNLSDLANEMSLAFEAPAYEKGLTLDPGIAPDLLIRGNADLLRQLLSILLDNAVKYTPKGGKIQVILKKDADKLSLCVQNSGVYIPQEHLSHIFDRFYRIDQARSNREGGHGLGLSIAAEIARQHGGTLKVTSHQEEGTSFILYRTQS
ncbi:MAG: HAMP domain-containing sensor histidine kinase [Bacillota bacterium]|nr:HAMP domain-containing sensor histidine kinase [Bacillota bacterium]